MLPPDSSSTDTCYALRSLALHFAVHICESACVCVWSFKSAAWLAFWAAGRPLQFRGASLENRKPPLPPLIPLPIRCTQIKSVVCSHSLRCDVGSFRIWLSVRKVSGQRSSKKNCRKIQQLWVFIFFFFCLHVCKYECKSASAAASESFGARFLSFYNLCIICM